MKPRRRTASRGLNLMDQLFAETEAMATYALASGLKVPGSILETLTNAEEALDGPPGARSEVAAGQGGQPSRAESVRQLAGAHGQMSHLVSPATPRTLLLLSRERREARMPFLGPVRLVRQMMLVAIVLLLTFMVTALSPDVNRVSGDIFTSSGRQLLINELFLLSAAGVGAAFTALFRANRYIANGTYDPKYESSYWVRFILGLIAGIVLPALIPVQGGQTLTRPLLALLGGFSASVVYRILSRLVDTLESLFKGDSQDVMEAREQALKLQSAEQRVQDQLRLAAALMRLRSEVESGSGTDQIKTTLARILDDFVPSEGSATTPGPLPSPDGNRSLPLAVN
jgi:hypothetical protein